MSLSRGKPLPDSWAYATLGEITVPRVDQGGPAGKEFVYIDIGSVDSATKRITDARTVDALQAPTRARQRLRRGDVLVSMTRPNLNAVALVPEELDGAVGSTGFHVLRSAAIEPKWLYYAVQSTDFIEGMTAVVQGALYPAVRPYDIRAFRIPIPPLQEQRRIVGALEEHLSDLDSAVAALTRARANHARLRNGVRSAAVEGSLATSIDRNRKGPDAWSPTVPANWQFATVEDLADLVEYGTSAKASDDIVGGIPVLRMGNIVDGYLSWDDLKYLPSSHAEFPDLLLSPGDVLFNRTNSPALVAKTAVYPASAPNASFASYLLRVRMGPRLLPEFFSAFVNSHYGRAWVASVVSQQVGQANVNGTKLRSLAVPVPPIEEQRTIVRVMEARLRTAEHYAGEIEKQLERAAGLRQSILRRAFEGELVPQDPADEPAASLLERVRSSAPEPASVPKKRATPRKSARRKEA